MNGKQVIAGTLVLSMLGEGVFCVHHGECTAHPERGEFTPMWEGARIISTSTLTVTSSGPILGPLRR